MRTIGTSIADRAERLVPDVQAKIRDGGRVKTRGEGKLKKFGLGFCVWLLYAVLVVNILEPRDNWDEVGSLIVALAAAVVTIYVFNRFAPPKKVLTNIPVG